jgi:hypothetical protein
MRKLILPIAAIAMASFVACSDDSSPNAPAAGPKQDALPASVEKFFDLDNNYTCSQTVNKCATVVVTGYSELAQCNGAQWDMQTLGNPVAGCENAAPATNPPATGTPATGAMVSCDIPGVLGECMEFPAGSAEATAMESQCVSVLMGTLGTGCAK